LPIFEILPNALYSRAALAERLAPLGIQVDHFTRRLRPRRVFRMAWLGADILAALASAEALRENPEEAGPAMAAPQNAGGRRAAQSQASADQIRTAFGIGPGRRTA